MIYACKTHGARRREIPLESENIMDFLKISLKEINDIKKISQISYYFRDSFLDCAGIDTWVIDIYFNRNEIPELRLKLPGEMPEERVINYIKPIIEKFTKYAAKECST